MNKVYLNNVEIFGNHGVFKEEKVLGQKFILSLELTLDFTAAAKNGDLSKSVHYGELCHKVEKIFQEKSYDLIETVVYKVAYYILNEYKMVQEVKVLLKKPWAPIGRHLEYAAVEAIVKRSKAYISLGSNIGDKLKYLNSAIEKINNLEGTNVTKKSDFIATEPWGYLEQDEFLNGVVEVETLLTEKELMVNLLEIEKELDRVREIKWGPRTIDLDIILYNDLVSNDDLVILPHPRMHLREFVLKPLNQIAPYAIHPLKKKRVFELLEELKK